MCLAVPGKIVSIQGSTATVDIAGVRRRVSLDLVNGAEIGRYVLVHVGFALQIIDEQEAKETLEMLQTYFSEELREETVRGEGTR